MFYSPNNRIYCPHFQIQINMFFFCETHLLLAISLANYYQFTLSLFKELIMVNTKNIFVTVFTTLILILIEHYLPLLKKQKNILFNPPISKA